MYLAPSLPCFCWQSLRADYQIQVERPQSETDIFSRRFRGACVDDARPARSLGRRPGLAKRRMVATVLYRQPVGQNDPLATVRVADCVSRDLCSRDCALNGANEAAALEHVLRHSAQLQALGAFVARTFGWTTDQRPSVNYYGDVNTVVVCDEKRRAELIAQRERLLEAESQGKVIELNGHKAKAAVTTLPAPETQPEANAGTENGNVTHDQSPATPQDPISRHMESIGRAETWRSEPEDHAGMFGPYPEELE